jgi:hypothetical protein
MGVLNEVDRLSGEEKVGDFSTGTLDAEGYTRLGILSRYYYFHTRIIVGL